MQRSYSVFSSPADGAFAKRYPALAHLPCILDGHPRYHRLANLYLMERGLRLWRPEHSAQQGIPTKKTMRSYADWLVNFLEWADLRRIDLNACSYAAHIAGRYQSEMLEGIWSRDGKRLAASTVNNRVQQACDFLTWMVEKELRGPFEVPYELRPLVRGISPRDWTRSSRRVRVRGGKARARENTLHMPTSAAVRQWLLDVSEWKGQTLGLMCETVLLTGMRREEVVALRVDTLPVSPSEWIISNPAAPESLRLVRISIRYGTKGPTYGEDHNDKIGPSRSILIPLSLARRWHAYRNGDRNLAFKRWMDGTKGADARRTRAQEAVHLFLQPKNGSRFTGKALYDAWVSVNRPIANWAPHQGRHWWACSVLLCELHKHEGIGQLCGDTAVALLESTALSIIRLQIQPQLGHADDSTTMIYLKWVASMVSLPVSLDVDITLNDDEGAQHGELP